MFKPLPTLSRLFRTAAGITAAAVLTAPAFGQTFFRFKPSSFAVSAGTYTPVDPFLSTPINVNRMGATTNRALNEGISSPIAIGFNFSYNGQTMTHFRLHTNGFIKLGTAGVDTTDFSPRATTGTLITTNASVLGSLNDGERNSIAPFHMDLDTSNNIADNFAYEVTGSSPNRVCTIQWKNMRDWSSSFTTSQYDAINFQVKLYETTNVVQFVYGTFTGTANSATIKGAVVGLRGNGETADHTLWVQKGYQTASTAAASNPPTTTGVPNTNNLGASFRLAGYTAVDQAYGYNHARIIPVVSGTTYTFTPVAGATQLSFFATTVENVTGTYTNISGGSAYVPVNAVPATDYDNGLTPAIPIGFSFSYNGTTYTQLRVSTNGFIKMGTGAPSSLSLFGTGAGLGPINSPSVADADLIVPMGLDLRGGNGTSPEIRVETSGGVCTIQWKNFRDVATSIYDNIEFQVKLYQTSNNVEFVYGNWTGATPTSATAKTASIGLRGTSDLPAQTIVANKNGSTWGWDLTSFSNSMFDLDGYAQSHGQRGDNAAYRPVSGRTFRFTAAQPNDLAITNIYALAKSPLVFGNPQVIGFSVQNVGLNAMAATTATFTAGAPNATSFTVPVPALGSLDTARIVFGSTFSPTNSGNTTLTVSVPADDGNANNSKSVVQNVNANQYSYDYPPAGSGYAGGVGFPPGNTGCFVGMFHTASNASVNAVRVNFAAPGNKKFKLGIWGDNGGKPGTLLYTSPANETSPLGGGGYEIAFCNPVNVPAGKFYVGLRQVLPNDNIAFSYENEYPIRPGHFFSTGPDSLGGKNVLDPSSGWSSFESFDGNFRLAIEVQLNLGVITPNCATIVSPANGATMQSNKVNLSYGSGGGNTLYYDVYLANHPTLVIGDLVASNTCASSYDPPADLAPNTTYYWKVVAKNENGSATGCATWSFTTAPLPANDLCAGAIDLTVCAPTATAGFTVNATGPLTSPGSACGGDLRDDVWYRFVASSNAHRLTVVPLGQFDPVIELRTGNDCNASTYLFCVDNGVEGGQETVNLTGFTVGQPYFLRIYGYDTLGTEGQFTVRVGVDGGWTGNVSSDWFSTGNWCDNQVPTSTTTATIRDVTTQPILTSDATVNNLGIDAGATLTINNGVTLDVRNTGTAGGQVFGPAVALGTGYILGNGTIRMSAAGAQPTQILTGQVQVQNLSVANTVGGVTVAATARMHVVNELSLQPSAKIDNLGLLHFKSSASGTGRFADIGTGTYSSTGGGGLFQVDRYINPGSGRWGLIGSPVQNAALTQWSELNTVINPMNNASLFWFDESDQTADYDNFSLDTVAKYGWTIPVNLLGGMNPGGNIRGWRAYIRGNFGGTLSVTGTPYTGNVNVPVSFTGGQYDGGGWNLIANPYASTIDWNNVTVPGTVNDAVFVFNGTQYQCYTKGSGTAQGVTVNGATRFIPSSQGFFIKTSAATSIQFQENDKTATTASFMREGDPVNQLRLTLKNSAGVTDETVIRFNEEATAGFDLRGDAPKPWGYVANLYSMDRDGKNYTVNSLPEVMSGRTIVPLGVEVYASGTYTINIAQLESFPANVSIRLRDKLNNTMVNPRVQSTYTFNVSAANPATQGRGRFEVIFDGAITANKGLLSNSLRLHIWPNPASGAAKANFAVQGFGAGKARAEVIDAMGRMVQAQNIELNGSGEAVYTISAGLTAGRYTLRVVSGTQAAVSSFTIE